MYIVWKHVTHPNPKHHTTAPPDAWTQLCLENEQRESMLVWVNDCQAAARVLSLLTDLPVIAMPCYQTSNKPWQRQRRKLMRLKLQALTCSALEVQPTHTRAASSRYFCHVSTPLTTHTHTRTFTERRLKRTGSFDESKDTRATKRGPGASSFMRAYTGAGATRSHDRPPLVRTHFSPLCTAVLLYLCATIPQ